MVILAAITDGLDGQASRLLGAQSKLGVLLDPIADKVFFLIVVATLLWDGAATWLEIVLISLRDLLVMAGAVGAWARDGAGAWVQMKPRWPGKLATALQFAFIAAVLLEMAAWRMPILIATAAVSFAAGIDYIVKYLLQGRSERYKSSGDKSE